MTRLIAFILTRLVVRVTGGLGNLGRMCGLVPALPG